MRCWRRCGKVLRDSAASRKGADQPFTRDEKSSWRQEAAKFIEARRTDDAATRDLTDVKMLGRKKNLCRLHAFDFLVALNNMIFAASGLHLLDFEVPGRGATKFQRDKRKEVGAVAAAVDRVVRVLVLIMDQGSTNWASTWFMQYQLGLALCVLPDPWHRLWNDIRNACAGSGFWGTILAMVIVFNVSYGPWNGEKWFNVITASALELAAVHEDGHWDPIFMHFVSRISSDKGDPTTLLTDAQVQELWDGILESKLWLEKGPRVVLTRWCNWLDCMDWFDKSWHERLVAITVSLLRLGVVGQGTKPYVNIAAAYGDFEEAEADKNTLEAKDFEKGKMKENKERLNRLRDKCKNSLHLCWKLMMNSTVLSRGRIVLECTRGLRLWMGEGIISCHTFEGVQGFYVDCAKGGKALASLCSVFKPLGDLSTLDRFGLHTDMLAGSAKYKDLDLDHPMVLAQGEIMQSAIDFVVSQLLERSRGLSLYFWGYPCRLAALLDADKTVVDACLDDAKYIWQAWLDVADNTDKHWTAFKKHACFQLPLVNALFLELAKDSNN